MFQLFKAPPIAVRLDREKQRGIIRRQDYCFFGMLNSSMIEQQLPYLMSFPIQILIYFERYNLVITQSFHLVFTNGYLKYQ
ncbi:uncharacterized protein CELE_F29F11.20 [Caenorhabditis elegans]|uniref:Uncharacterized protein n=1 Tax=Caenorhabditis elegans TaxID=6239 RepID=G3MU15_CAEEL|nr:Uncharacterized protein CELE_F29F11.20 [Caenorhabditis elegans]CCD31071.1 Uncharacterized protein CELE_F29F11.20 [Caenorhabditis elegans]|eukprot:NP_001256251.1 Uncharacterized protein CELE_F29F11.20 [Caenorhabditis elegans]